MPRRQKLRGKDAQVIQAFQAGETRSQIAKRFGVNAATVASFLRIRGFQKYTRGGPDAIGGAKQRTRQYEKRRKHSANIYGMPASAIDEIRQRRRGEPNRRALTAFYNQRNTALNRGQGWALTFMQWWELWSASGRWTQRGREGYVLKRLDKRGQFCAGNVVIALRWE